VAKLIDLFALAIVAFVLLLPQPTVVFSPGFAGDKSDLDRIAVLEDSLYRKKDDVEVAVDLARAYLRIEQPVWAIATLRPYKGAGSYQVHQVLATAYATVLRFDLGLAEAESGMAQCESQGPRCPEVTQIRARLPGQPDARKCAKRHRCQHRSGRGQADGASRAASDQGAATGEQADLIPAGEADFAACGQADHPAPCQAVAAHAFAAERLSPVARAVLGAAAGKSRL
jgi:hypothetical protein